MMASILMMSNWCWAVLSTKHEGLKGPWKRCAANASGGNQQRCHVGLSVLLKKALLALNKLQFFIKLLHIQKTELGLWPCFKISKHNFVVLGLENCLFLFLTSFNRLKSSSRSLLNDKDFEKLLIVSTSFKTA